MGVGEVVKGARKRVSWIGKGRCCAGLNSPCCLFGNLEAGRNNFIKELKEVAILNPTNFGSENHRSK